MNITIAKFASLIQMDYSLDVLYVLDNIEDILGVINTAKGAALLQRMFRKGLIDEQDRMTEKGKELLRWAFSSDEDEIRKIERPKALTGLASLHKKLENKIIELTGKKQVRVDIKGSKYSFLCNDKDLQERVKRVMARYKLSDYEKIENQLLRYIETCHRKNFWAPLLIYYIFKDGGGSRLVTDLQSGEEDVPTAQTVVDI